MKNFVLGLFLALSFTASIKGQDKETVDKKQVFSDAMYFYEREDYSEALYNFKKLYQEDSTNANINYRIGCCYLEIPGKEEKAIPYLQRASKDITEKYNEYAYKERKAPLHTLFYLARAYRLDNQIKKSIRTIKQFKDSPYFPAKYNKDIVQREMKTCQRAKILQDNPVDISSINLGSNINDSRSDIKPVISGNERHLVYIKKLIFYDALFYSKKRKDGKWSQPINISSNIGSDGKMYPTDLSYNGDTLLLTKEIEEGNKDLFMAYFKDGEWNKAKKLSSKINSNQNETHASLSKSGDTLYFTSNKGFINDKYDIYRSIKDDNGEWKRPSAIDIINSEWDEATPFITNNNKMLIFSSKGHYNMGEYDIFYSLKIHNGGWTKPQNIGYPINTTKDDKFFVPANNGKYAYYAKKPDQKDHFDIYKMKLLFAPFQQDTTAQKTSSEIITIEMSNPQTQDTIRLRVNPQNKNVEAISESYKINKIK